jgi:hypothetical protein
MDSCAVLSDGFARVVDIVHAVVPDLSPAELVAVPGPGANHIGWLIWHLTRIQDDHISAAFGLGQLWNSDRWADRFDLPFPDDDTGYGHSTEDVTATVVSDSTLLTGYFDAVAARTRQVMAELNPDELDRIVDERWRPPVTLGVRLMSVISDDLQHAGQAAYVKGLLRSSR